MSPTKCSSLLAIALTVAGLCSCNRQSQQPQYANYAGDPADGNLAPADQYTAQPPQAPAGYQTPAAPPAYRTQEAAYYQPIAEAPEPPPPLPEYDQPACPGENYEWTPGYWDYSSGGYYWVPGAWVMAPWVGALWTPPWWGYSDNVYVLHPGYWAPHIGFYGGIDYGHGYTGRGYYGAYWDHGAMRYNRAVTNVNPTVVRNVYQYSVPDRRQERTSYNGGRGGLEVRPSAPELAVVRDPRTPAVVEQVQHARQASSNRAQFASRDHARPAALAVPAPLATTYHAPSPRPPAAALREVPRSTGRSAPVAHNEPRPSAPPNVPAAQPASRFDRSGNVPRSQQPEPRESRPGAPPAASASNRPNAPAPMPRQEAPNRPTPENRRFGAPRPGPVQANVPQARPAPQTRAAMPRPQIQNRPEPQRAMAPRPEPQHAMAPPAAQPRPEPQRAMAPRPQPQHASAAVQPRPEPQRAITRRPEPQRAMAPPAAQPRPEPQRAMPPRPEPQRAMALPAVQPRPEPQRAVAPRPQPQHAVAPPMAQPRPEPQHAREQRPAPHVFAQAQPSAPHPAPQVRPEPQHAAPPAARPAPPPRAEERKK